MKYFINNPGVFKNDVIKLVLPDPAFPKNNVTFDLFINEVISYSLSFLLNSPSTVKVGKFNFGSLFFLSFIIN